MLDTPIDWGLWRGSLCRPVDLKKWYICPHVEFKILLCRPVDYVTSMSPSFFNIMRHAIRPIRPPKRPMLQRRQGRLQGGGGGRLRTVLKRLKRGPFACTRATVFFPLSEVPPDPPPPPPPSNLYPPLDAARVTFKHQWPL